MLRYATVCSGVEAVSLAWEPLGLLPVFFSEIEPFPSAVLAERWPSVPNLGDLTKIDGSTWRGQVDVLWASFPCQDYSLAGGIHAGRAGAAGERGGLTLKGVQLVDDIDPHFFCFENVKGILSDRGNAFGHFLAGLVGEDRPLEPSGGRWTHSGYVHGPRRSVAWRLLDAKYGGVAQRRERVFLLACPRNGADPKQVLFEREGLLGNPPSGVEASARAAVLAPCGSGPGRRQLSVFGDLARCLTAGATMRLDADTEDFVAEVPADIDIDWLMQKAKINQIDAAALAQMDIRIRKLTPVECERLQGFPDNHTRIAWKGKGPDLCPDGPRYKAIGNSLAVPEVRWIGQRILAAVQTAIDRRAA